MRRTQRPATLDEALDMLAAGDATPLAGGTDIYPAVAQADAWAEPAPLRLGGGDLVDLGGLAELRGIAEREAAYELGAGVTWSELLAAELPPCFDGLKLAAREVGGRQIQNQGTLAGNLCNASPAADGVPALLALDARVRLQSGNGARELPLADFITGVRETALRPDEIMTAILVPKLPETARANFLKLGARRYLVISIAMVSALVVPTSDRRVEELRVAVGACSAVAQRLPALEARAVGQPLAALAALPMAGDVSHLTPISDARADADYRREAALVLARRVLAGLAGSGLSEVAA